MSAETAHRAKVRVVGSNYTTFLYNGKSIAYLEVIQDTGQRPLGGQGYEFIHPLGYRTPVDVVTGRVLDGGVITLTIRELWNQNVWEQLAGLAGTDNIVDIFERLARQENYVSMTKIITPPKGPKYGKIYHRCVIVDIEDGETVNIGALSVPKTITVAYTHTSRLKG